MSAVTDVLAHVEIPALEQAIAEALQAHDVDSLAQLLHHLAGRAPERFDLTFMAMEIGVTGMHQQEALYAAAVDHLSAPRGLDALIPPKE